MQGVYRRCDGRNVFNSLIACHFDDVNEWLYCPGINAERLIEISFSSLRAEQGSDCISYRLLSGFN